MARMNELTEPMIAILRKVARGDQPKPGATRSALLRRGLVEWSAPNEVALTDAGRVALDALDGKVPATPQPGSNPDGSRMYATSDGPSVLLSPTTEPAEVPDAELLQLLALLDSGVRITRRLYQAWRVDGSPITLDPVKVDRAARAAIADGLATRTVEGIAGREVFVLRAEPIHLAKNDSESVCKRRLRRAGGQRLRYTTDASKATHDRCKR